MPEPPYTNQRPFPNVGSGLSFKQFQEHVAGWITKASDALEGTQVIIAARNSMSSPQAELQAVIWARDNAHWVPAAEAKLTARINELSQLIHRTEGGPIRF